MTYNQFVRISHKTIRQSFSIHIHFRDGVTIVSRVLMCVEEGVSDERF